MGEATDARFACRSCDFVTNHTKASQDHRALTGHSVRWTGRPPTAADLVQDQADLLRPSDERGQALEDAARLVEARAVGAFTPSLWRDCAADIRAMATRPAPGASRPSAEPSEAARQQARAIVTRIIAAEHEYMTLHRGRPGAFQHYMHKQDEFAEEMLALSARPAAGSETRTLPTQGEMALALYLVDMDPVDPTWERAMNATRESYLARAGEILAALAAARAPETRPRNCPHVGCALPEPHEHPWGVAAVPPSPDATTDAE
jgi:hypothetical protein